MTSSGASIVPETARRCFRFGRWNPALPPDALMSAHHGRKLGFPDLLSFDMGGTTAKGRWCAASLRSSSTTSRSGGSTSSRAGAGFR